MRQSGSVPDAPRQMLRAGYRAGAGAPGHGSALPTGPQHRTPSPTQESQATVEPHPVRNFPSITFYGESREPEERQPISTSARPGPVAQTQREHNKQTARRSPSLETHNSPQVQTKSQNSSVFSLIKIENREKP